MVIDKRQGRDNRRSEAADSFVIDLRHAFAPAQKAAKEEDCPKKLEREIRKTSVFQQAANMLQDERKRRKHYRHFSVSPRYRWRLSQLFRRRQSVIPRSFGLLERNFARISRLEWKRMRGMAGKMVKPKAEQPAEFLVVWYRSLFAFIVALIFIILPFKLLAYFKILDFDGLKTDILARSISAFDNLATASEEAAKLDLVAAGDSFERAGSDFISAQQELSRVDSWLFSLAAFSNDPKIRLAASGKEFLAAGIAGAEFGRHLSAAGDVFLKAKEERSWGMLIDAFVEHGTPAMESAIRLQSVLADIDPKNLPDEYRDRFLGFRAQAAVAVDSLSTLLNSAKEIKEFIGVSQDRRYLLVFQNNTEMRGSGGFFGSYALVDLRDGNIRKLEVPAGGPYDTEAGMTSFIRSPKPLWLVNPRWYLWDANWWPDWPTSARSLMWFYEKSGGSTVDGVISFTPDVLEDLLRITGPIDLRPEYELTVDADNFWELIQATVEKDNLKKTHPSEVSAIPDSPENKPKKIIGDLMAKIMERLPQVLSAENAPVLIGALEKNLSAKNIMLYFADPNLQEKAARYHLDGAIAQTKGDYLLVAHTNIAGQKSDRRMDETISHSSEIAEDGGVIDTLIIRRTHNGIKNEMLTGVRNVDWLRVYVPAGSQLLEATGFNAPDSGYFEEPELGWSDYEFVAETEGKASTDLRSGTKIYDENGKTVFANWVMTDPGNTSTVRIRYRLPFKVIKGDTEAATDFWSKLDALLNPRPTERVPYSLLWQKQPGAKPANIETQLTLPAGWKQIWNADEGWGSAGRLERDIIKATLIEKN